ncbi:hypothetical protein Y032_0002g1127 [Ancylostoma ceylanicum]|uniref:Uncharacterized protein n=1 Tax=Ancylostoma ceylanicum TaxID=53326 RepID=A0A016W0P3_9BILA|nr:hypothetical protein Y032_0002g1127 [Ancylostoma ceylanicum]
MLHSDTVAVKKMNENDDNDVLHCIRNDESAQAVHVTPGSLLDITKTTMKRDTQSRYDDVDCSQALLPRPLGRTRRFG